MRFSVKMPRVAETTDEVVIDEWVVKVGDEIVEGEALVRVETDKALVDIPSPITGTLVEQRIPEGGDALTGTVIAVIEAKN